MWAEMTPEAAPVLEFGRMQLLETSFPFALRYRRVYLPNTRATTIHGFQMQRFDTSARTEVLFWKFPMRFQEKHLCLSVFIRGKNQTVLN
jgi:hypothetical protein